MCAAQEAQKAAISATFHHKYLIFFTVRCQVLFTIWSDNQIYKCSVLVLQWKYSFISLLSHYFSPNSCIYLNHLWDFSKKRPISRSHHSNSSFSFLSSFHIHFSLDHTIADIYGITVCVPMCICIYSFVSFPALWPSFKSLFVSLLTETRHIKCLQA